METEKRKGTDKKEDRNRTRRKLREQRDQTNRGKTIARQKLTETKKREESSQGWKNKSSRNRSATYSREERKLNLAFSAVGYRSETRKDGRDNF